MFRKLHDFDQWANDRMLRFLESLESPPPRVVRLMAHILAAKRLWLARLTGQPEPNERFPEWTMQDFPTLHAELTEGWTRFLENVHESDLARIETYQDTHGQSWSTPLGDILAHVATHGHYHRGQIAVELAAHGHTPPSTDLIVASRAGALAG